MKNIFLLYVICSKIYGSELDSLIEKLDKNLESHEITKEPYEATFEMKSGQNKTNIYATSKVFDDLNVLAKDLQKITYAMDRLDKSFNKNQIKLEQQNKNLNHIKVHLKKFEKMTDLFIEHVSLNIDDMSVFSERFIDQHPLPPMLYLHDGLYEIGQHEIVVQVSFFKKNDLKLNLYQAKLFKIYKSISIDLDPNLGDIDVSVSIDLQNNETYNLSVKKNSHDL